MSNAPSFTDMVGGTFTGTFRGQVSISESLGKIMVSCEGCAFHVPMQIIEVSTRRAFVVNISDAEMDRADRETEARNG